jgi:dihydroxyacetone kinase-like protein
MSERVPNLESSQSITAGQVHTWLLMYADRIDENAEWLTQLDAAIGDADHGANMVRGMQRVRTRLSEADAENMDLPTLLRTVAMTLISNVGGAAGALYGAFFLRASKQVSPQEMELSADGAAHERDAPRVDALTALQFAQAFQAGVEGVRQRGKVKVGEKTMVDTLQPVADALLESAQAGKPLQEVIDQAREAAQKGMNATIPLEATKGRASYLGMRSIGHQDPGATSACLLVTTLWEVISAGEYAKQASVALEKKDLYT